MGHPFGPKWPIFFFYPKGLPTSCLMQIYHLGLNCRVSKNGPPFWAKVAHFHPNIMSDAELPFGVKLQGFQKWATLLGQSGPFSFFYPKGLPTTCLMQIYHMGLNCRVSKNGPLFWAKVAHFPFLPQGSPNNMSDADLPFGVKIAGFPKMGHPFGPLWPKKWPIF